MASANAIVAAWCERRVPAVSRVQRTLSGAHAVCGSGAALIDVSFGVTRSVASAALFCDTSAVWVPAF
jgi:hypothetical protein